ncbi:MAG: 2-C-methyl-D-erythritol 4-phosphate cytidylyltransferase [Candidatus Eisenbacteria sp.]|nr:2-C-methyl-D-erythritol 4-phosphate cytidylyltransferase [Candidatus Eisenbacteria bacterium]
MEPDSANLHADAPPPAPRGRCWALILAGGLGVRLGGDRPKAFVEVAAHPLLHWSLLAFARHPRVTDLLVVVPRGLERVFREEILSPLFPLLGDQATKIRGIVPGGEHRQDSARLGLKAAYELWQAGEEARRSRVAPAIESGHGESAPAGEPEAHPADALVLIHDAARPLVPVGLIDALLERLQVALEEMRTPPTTKGGRARKKKPKEPSPPAVIPVVPVGETLKALDESQRLIETVTRQGLWCAQTPQAFQLRTVLDLHEQAMEAGYAVTDDAMLYEWRDWSVLTIPGSPLNIKVTFPEEVDLLEGWLARHAGEMYDRRAPNSTE